MKKAENDMLHDFYNNASALIILNEIISNFVVGMPRKQLKAIMNGRISVDECVDGVLEDATNELGIPVYDINCREYLLR